MSKLYSWKIGVMTAGDQDSLADAVFLEVDQLEGL